MNINERNRIMVTMTAVFAVIGLVSFILAIRKDSNTTVAPPTTAASVETSSSASVETFSSAPKGTTPTASSAIATTRLTIIVDDNYSKHLASRGSPQD